MVSVDKLLEQGLLKKTIPSRERAAKSLQRAEKFLEEAKRIFDHGSDETAILAVYEALFHSARAILFVDGYGERSHYAVCEYLREKHPSLGLKEINGLDMYRDLRHSVAYGLESKITPKDSAAAVNFAVEFVGAVKKYLKF